MTKSAVPLAMGATTAGMKAGTSDPSPSMKQAISEAVSIAATPAAQARP